ncbi:hypothetical protein, partial [Yersinia sp. Marseille-Q5920]|uniref:hypothetical protein n=1 Tax=Yersinia sp. Marseille-Q5920 TaxID=2972785 RepID=UPI002264343C
MASQRWKNYQFNGVLTKDSAVEKFFQIRGCSLSGTPYNAPPLTGNNETHFAGSGREKNDFD